MLSLDHDGERFLEVGGRDPVIGELQRLHPGQRPVLFYSPYEAAAWSVISARRQPAVAATLRRELGVTLGRTFELAGEQVVAFPQPDRLLEAVPMPGLGEEKIVRLRGVAQAHSPVPWTRGSCVSSDRTRPGAHCSGFAASAPSTAG